MSHLPTAPAAADSAARGTPASEPPGVRPGDDTAGAQPRSRKHARSKCAFKMMMTTFSPPTYSCSRHPSPDKSASRRRRANRAPSERNRKKSTLRGNRDDSFCARSNSTPVLATSVSNSPRALTAPIDCNNPAFTQPRFVFERSAPDQSRLTRRGSRKIRRMRQQSSERVERKRVDAPRPPRPPRANEPRSADANASMSTASTTARAPFARGWN